MSDLPELTELQVAILDVLWDRGEATVSDVHEALADRDLAPTTVATMLRRLEKRGVIDHRTEGRQFVYRAAIPRQELEQSMVGGLLRRLFRGRSTDFVCRLLSESELDREELDRVKALLAQKEAGLKKRKGR